MLNAGDLTGMRATAGAALPDRAVIENETQVSDGGGGETSTWTAAGTVDCRLAPIRGDESEHGDRIAPDVDCIVTLPFDAPVDERSRLTIGGGTYSVASVRDRSWNLTRRVEAKRLT